MKIQKDLENYGYIATDELLTFYLSEVEKVD